VPNGEYTGMLQRRSVGSGSGETFLDFTGIKPHTPYTLFGVSRIASEKFAK